MKNRFWWLGFCIVVVLKRLKYCIPALCMFSLIIVKSLQLCGLRQIAESRKYCFVCVIVFFFDVCFLYFLSLKGWEFRVNSLHISHTKSFSCWPLQRYEHEIEFQRECRATSNFLHNRYIILGSNIDCFSFGYDCWVIHNLKCLLVYRKRFGKSRYII